MASRPLNILLLFDLSVDISPEEYPEYLKTEEWKNDANLYNTLKKLGHEVKILGLYQDIQPLIDEIKNNRPDLVFNQSEAFANKREFEPHLVSLLELLKVPYTGSGPEALRLCKDKGMTKQILSFHRIQLPRFLISRKSHPIRSLRKFTFPAFIKPLSLEASEGISQLSFADNESDALDRVRFIHESLGEDALIEEYIEGREIYVGVLGNEKLTTFPPRELFFKHMPEDGPKFATFKAKWDDAYRKKWGIGSDVAKPIDEAVMRKIEVMCKKIYRLLRLRGYGRIDLRVKPDGEVYFIEANPNPSIGEDEDFALAAAQAGMSYKELLSKIISLA